MADEKNKGGFWGGLGYFGQSLLAGIGNIGEGAIDAILAPLADLTGNHEFAESLFKKNWVGDWYSDVTEDFNPGTGWEFAGNVAHGLGQSAYLFIPYAGAPIFFSGIMAQGISSAAQQTGEVGIKEAAYGLTTGAVEGALEYVGGAAAKGAKSLFKSGAKSAVKSTVRKGLVKQVLSDAASEFTEEAMSEVIDVGLQRLYGINPDAQLSVKDVLYAGAVGAVSGAVTTTAVQVPLNLKNRARGEKIIKDGNSQTLVNTATSIADRLAGQGTDWDKAPEWAAAIRGQVDAYEKLSSVEKNGIRGQTLLGEMQSSLFFAEHQSVFNEVQKNIQNADEQSRATWAEYINKSVSKERRNNRDFTAEDVKNNTDNVAWQLAIYKYVPAMFNLDAAVVDLDTAQESEIADVMAKQGGAEQTAPMGAVPAMQFDLDENAVNLRSDAVEVNGEQTGAETVQDETAGASPRPTGEFDGQGEVIDGATSSSTVFDGPPSPLEKADLDRAKRDAERIIEWERKEAPTVDELNRVRGAVKNFDSLSGDRQMSIVRMMRTSKNVDEQTVRGLANLMSITNKKGQVLASDVEIRFADGIGARGVITTTSGGKKVILVDSSAKRSETFRGTIAHELVHYLENRKGYKALAAYAYKIAKNEKIQEVEDLYDRHYKRTFAEEARRANPNASAEEIAARVEERMSSAEYQELVESEVTASIVGEALKSEKFLKRYAQAGEEKGVLKTAARFIKGIFNSTKDKDAELSREAQNLAVLFDRALASEVEGEQKSGEKYSFSSIGYSFFGRDDVTIEEFESGAYKQTEGYKAYVDECLSNMRQSRADFNEVSAKREIERSIDGIVRVAIAAKNAGYDIYDSAAQRTTKDSKKRLLFSSLEPNSDYFTSSDISTICDKRKNFTEIENEINRIEAERNVPREKRFFADINNFFVLHDILARHGLTTACRQCYVESMRKNLGRMANAFITLVTEENADNKKNAQLYNNKGVLKTGNADLRVKVRELMAEEGIDANYLTFERLTNGENLAEMRLQYPLLYEAYNSFYGQSKPKMPKSATPFRFGELTALLTDNNGKINKSLVRQIESTGGFRLQSYSDFQIKNYVDVLQVIFEAGTLGLTGHAYTKVPAFLDATANTNLKRNISIFMYRDGDEWKIDRKDSFPYALDKIYDIVDADKSGDTGIIAVSQNDDMSAWIMANDQIAYGIPFHKSGTKMGVVRETVVYEGKREIKGYTGIKDHTRMQSEVYARGADKGKKVKSPINIYSFWDFDSTRMSKKNLIEKNLKAYIDACEEKGYLPKFRDYVMNNEKVLNSTLEYAKKLGAVGAYATVSDISFKYKGYTIPYGYYKFLGDFSMFTPDGKASPHEVLSLKNYDFDAAVNFFADSKKLRINELLQQLDNGPEREKYRKLIDEGKITITELGQVIKKKRDAVVAEVVDRNEKFDLDGDVEEDNKPKVKSFSEVAVSTALYDALDHKDGGYDNLILMSKMPRFISDRFGIAGNFYVYRDHLYENTVSKERAIEEGRPTIRGKKDIHFHNLGEERMIEAIMSIDSPIISVEVHSKNNNPTIIMALPVLDDDGSPLRAVLSFYSDQVVNGSFEFKPHIVLTITPCKMSESIGARKGWAEFISEAVEQGRVLTYDKEKGSVLSVIAQQARLGNITEASLNDSISRFKRSVNEFKQKNKINYDLDPEIEAEQDGEVSDEYFEAAVARARKEESLSAEERRQLAQERNKEAVEKRKAKFEKLLSRAMSIQNQIEKLRKNATDTESKAKLKKLKKDFNNVLGDLGALQIELRQMGYDLSAEQRLIERQQEQIENQGKQILTLKEQNRNLKRAEREDQIIKMVETRENARMAELFAKQKAEITSVYSEDEIKRELRDMLDKGLIPQFFGGDYQPKLSKAKIEAISRYIAIQLNTTGSAEKAEAQGLIRVAALDIVRNIKFTEEDSKARITLDEIADAESREYFVDAISAKLEQMVRNAGELNPYAELQRKYNNLKAEIKNNEGEAWGREFPKVVAEAKRMRNFAVNKKNMAADGVQEVLKSFATLTDESGRLYSGRVDSVMQAALSFFEGEAMRTNSERDQVDKDNKIADDSMIWDIDPDLKDAIELFVQLRRGREGTLMNSQELKLVREILSGMRTSLERYNKEKIGGKFVDIDRAAGEKVRFMQTDVESKTFTSKLLNSKLGRAFRNAYFYEVLSPATVFESLDGYEIGGLLTTLYRDIRMAAQSAIDMKARLKDPFVRYVDDKENAWKDEKGHSRSYRQKLNEKKISVDGVNITLGEAINLYMLTKREHAHLGLQEGGFVTYDENGVKVAKIKIPDIEIARNNLYNQFDATDRKFIEMAEDFFNKTASKIKEDADIEIYGYSKNSEGYYVPIVRDHYSRNNGVTDVRQSISNFATVNNKSFTKDLVRNANPLEGQNILGLIETHADGLADYANLYMPLKAFDRVYNRGVSIDGGEVTTLREQLNEEWNGAHRYFTKLFKDIQGVRDGDPPSNVDKVASWIRSNWVASVLGANLKVVCTQTTSLGAATQIIDAKYVTKASWIITPGTGFAKGVKEIAERADKYSKTIFSRSFDAGAVKAQGNLDKIGNIAKGASTLIGIQDRKVCIALFHAAELSVEASTGHKVGTEENSVLAAKLVDEAILTTQAMESQAEKSNLQRANSELAKLFSMFTSDSVKNLSHLISNISRYAAHKNRAKNGDARYQAELKKDGKAARRSIRTMLITGVMLGVITQGFKWLYGKEEEEPEEILWDFAGDVASSTLNVFPIISDLIDKFLLDYDMSINVLDVVNDTVGTLSDGFELMGKAIGGQYVSDQDIGKNTVNIGKSALSLFGIPVSPVERTMTGLLRRFFPSAIYGYDSMMSNPSYSADLRAAVEDGDEALAEHILETIYKNEATGVYSTPELEEVARLYGLGNTSVIPQKIGTTINDVTLDRKQRAQFEKIYGEASAKVNELIRSDYYAELNDEQRAKAIKNLYSLYYNRAAAEVAGVEWSNAQAYSRLTDNYAALFAAQAYKSGLKPYKTLRGKEVSVKDQFVKYVENLGLNEVDKLVVLYANGYRDAKTKKKMLAYINSLSISEEEKTRIAERLGFAVENGKVVEKKEELEVRTE